MVQTAKMGRSVLEMINHDREKQMWDFVSSRCSTFFVRLRTCLLALLTVLSPICVDADVMRLYILYGYEIETELRGHINRFPFVHALIEQLSAQSDDFVLGLMNMAHRGMHHDVDMDNLFHVEKRLATSADRFKTIESLKNTLYQNKWWQRINTPKQ